MSTTDDLDELLGIGSSNETAESSDPTDVPWDEAPSVEDIESAVTESTPPPPPASTPVSAPVNNTPPSVEGDITNDLKLDQYSLFLDSTKFISHLCDDLVIKNGEVIAIARDKSALIHVDLSAIFPNQTLLFSRMDDKYEIFDIFRKQKIDVFIDTLNSKGIYVVRDSLSGFRFPKPDEKLLTTSSVTLQVMNEKVAFDPDQRIFSITLNKILLDRVATATKNLNCGLILIDFVDGKCELKLTPSDQSSTMIFNLLTLSDELDINDMTGYIPFPLRALDGMLATGITEIQVELYKTTRTDNVVAMNLSCELEKGSTKVPLKAWLLAHPIVEN